MEPADESIVWEAREHHHEPKNSDWFWVLGILVLCAVVASVILGNVLLAIVLLIGGSVMGVLAMRPAQMVTFVVSARGVKIGDELHPFSTLESYHIEDHPKIGPQLLLKSKQTFMQLLILPLPSEAVADIEAVVGARLPEEFLEEPFVHKLMEVIGF